MHWGHSVTTDMISWEQLPAALAPDQDYDRNGCFSGSAIEADNKHVLVLSLIHISPEKLDEVELTDTCMLSELTNRINALCEENDRKKLTASFINQLLVEKGYLEETVQGEEKIKRVTEKGRAVGIREEERQAKYGRNYYALIHTRESQQMILEELGKYLLQFTPAV